MAWKLFTDAPVADIGDADLARSNQVVRSLYAQLQLAERQVKANSNKTNEHKSYDYARFALCGGLGQGKSSAVLQLRKLLQRKIKSDGVSTNTRQAWVCRLFDISQYRHLELEYSLDDFIHSFFLWRSLLRLVLLLLICLSIAGLQLLSNTFFANLSGDGQSDQSSWVEYMVQWADYLLAALVLMWNSPKLLGNITRIWLSSYRKEFLHSIADHNWKRCIKLLSNYLRRLTKKIFAWLRSSYRDFAQYFADQGLIKALTKSIKNIGQQIFAPAKPRLVIIDNLDRASIQQQRSLLRGLYKNQQLLHFHVLLVLDENSLMLAANDPESPQELLRKVTDAQFRLPARSPETLVWQVLNLCHESAEKNSEAKFFQQPIFCCDLLLLLSWLPNPGPRLIKQLLNNLLIHSEGNLTTLDASALLKICAIDLLAPGLRLRPGLLLELLNSTVSTELEAILVECEKNAELKRGIDWPRLRGLLTNTMSLRPQSDGGNWSNLIAAFLTKRNDNIQVERYLSKLPKPPKPLSIGNVISSINKQSLMELQLGLQLLQAITGGRSYKDSLLALATATKSESDPPSDKTSQSIPTLILLNLFASKRRHLSREQRWLFYNTCIHIINGHRDESCKDESCKKYMLFLLYRCWCYDEQVIKEFPDNIQKHLFDSAYNSEKWHSYVLMLMPSDIISTKQYIEIIPKFNVERNEIYLSKWWENVEKTTSEQYSDLTLNISSLHDVTYLESVWPANFDHVSKSQCLESLHLHISWLQQIVEHGVWPASLERLLFENGFWQELSPEEQSKLLQALAFRKRQPNLPLLTAFLEGRPTYFYKDDTNGLARLTTQIQDSDSAACLLLIDCLARSKKSIRDEDKIELAQPHYSSLIMHLNNAHLLAVLINKLTVDFLWTRLDLPALRSCLVLLSQLGDGEQLKSDLLHILVRVNNENLPQLISQQNNIRLLPALSGDPEMDANLLKLLDSCSYSLRANYIFNHHQQLLNTNARNILEHHQMLALLFRLITNAPAPSCPLIELPNKLAVNDLPSDDITALMLKRAILQARRRLLEFNQKHLVQLVKLKDSEASQVLIKFSTIHRFNVWFDYYHPCLCLQLPEEPDDVMEELQRRLQVLLQRSLDLELNQDSLLDRLFDTLSSEIFKRALIAHTGSN